jgi:hypothetical protein
MGPPLTTTAGNDLVAVRNQNQRVKCMSLHNRFNRISDQLPAGKRKLHTRVVHCDTITDTDRPDLKGCAASGSHAGFDGIGNLAQMRMAGNNLAIRVHHAYKGLIDLPFGNTQCAQKGTVRRTLYTFLDCITSHSLVLLYARLNKKRLSLPRTNCPMGIDDRKGAIAPNYKKSLPIGRLLAHLSTWML